MRWLWVGLLVLLAGCTSEASLRIDYEGPHVKETKTLTLECDGDVRYGVEVANQEGGWTLTIMDGDGVVQGEWESPSQGWDVAKAGTKASGAPGTWTLSFEYRASVMDATLSMRCV